MSYILRKDNVERIVDSEDKKATLIQKGYKEVVVKSATSKKAKASD